MPFSKEDHNIQAYIALYNTFISLQKLNHSSRISVKEILDGLLNSMTKEEKIKLSEKGFKVQDVEKVKEKFESAVDSLLQIISASLKKEIPIILVAEDQRADRFLFEKAWKSAGLKPRLIFVHNGLEVIWYIENNKKPDLILLDLRMPVQDGFETLQELKKRKYPVPVVVLSTSNNQLDKIRAKNLGASYYISKPSSLEGFIEIVKSVDSFYTGINPSQEE